MKFEKFLKTTLTQFLGIFSVSASLLTKEEKKAAQNFMKQCKSQIKYSTGKAPPKDGNEDAWMNSVISSPEPLTITLESLGSLEPLKKYLKNKPEVMSNIKRVIQDYCNELKSEGAVSSCNQPGPDPPFPGKKS